MGEPGVTGAAGTSVAVSEEPPGDNCAAGGFALTSATGTAYVCNGADGTDGSDATAPAGAIVAYGGDTPPAGWLLCDGAAVSRTTYAALYAAIANNWGDGDGTSTFELPDLRGRFLRGVDHATGRDPDAAGRIPSAGGGNSGDQVGTIEGDQFRSHTHVNSNGFVIEGGIVNGHFQGGSASSYTVWATTVNTGAAGGNETRPLNASINYIIKY